MAKEKILICHWLPDGERARWAHDYPRFEFFDAREADVFDEHKEHAVVCYGAPEIHRLEGARALRWIQLASAGVPQGLCSLAEKRGLTISNLAGLYGPSIAEHALALM